MQCADLAVALAEAVLDDPTVQLTRKALAGRPFAHARATELAERVFASKPESLSRNGFGFPRLMAVKNEHAPRSPCSAKEAVI